MKNKIIIFSILLMLFFSCEKNNNSNIFLQNIFNSINTKYVSDKRITIHNLNFEVNRKIEKVIIKGETEFSKSILEIKDSLKLYKFDYIDSSKICNINNPNSSEIGIINVSVANLRREPKESAELLSQVLMGTEIYLIKNIYGWYFVQCNDKYLGWISDDSFIQLNEIEFQNRNKSNRVIVIANSEIVRSEANSTSNSVSDVVSGCILDLKNIKNNWLEIILPDKRIGFLPKNSCLELTTWNKLQKVNELEIEKTAKSFLGSPYLWGGTSTKGMDCSGFTKTVFMMNRIKLLRDANQQALQGIEIETDSNLTNLKKGDLLFFGKINGNKKSITHVGIYLDSGNVIHASGMVKINNFFSSANNYSERFSKTFITARRFLQ